MTTDWMDQINKAKKFREKSITHGRKVYARYEDKRDANEGWIKKANFFYANVNILKESLFNSLPKPDVSRVQKGNFLDDASRVAALIVERGLTYEINCAPNFDEAITSAIIERLVPGTGQVWVRFGVEQEETKSINAEGKEVVNKSVKTGTEQIFVDHVFWEDFFYQPARLWSKVTWVARRIYLTQSEIETRWGKGAMAKVGDKSKDSPDNLTPDEINENKYPIYEIWDKKSKKVIFQGDGGKEPLETKNDPYKLLDFFPCPRPLIANVTTNKFLPVTDYHISQDQYAVLDTLYARTNLIIKAIKVAGIYNGSSMDIQKMLTSAENTLIPVDNWAMMAENGGVAGNIEWYPVEKVAQVLQQLQTQFEAAKSLLYEITGMSDIIRGASNQYETAQAQQIKAQFASVRMNGYQRDVAIFVRDTLRIVSEIMCQLYSIEKLKKIVGELSPPDMEFAEQAVGILRDDFLTHYSVNIQANSLTQADWALEKTQRMEVVQTLGQMIQGVMQGAQESPQLAVLGVNMIKFALAGFKGASEIEGYVDQTLDDMMREMQQAKANPQPPKPTPEEQKAQAEMQKMQMEGQQEQARFQMEQQAQQAQLAADAQKQQMEMDGKEKEMGMKLQMMQAERAHKERMYELEIQLKFLEMQLDQERGRMQLELDEAKNVQTLDQNSQKHEQSLEQRKEASEAEPKETE